MTLSNKNILLISPEPWGHIFVSKHHYAIHLVKMDANVVFVNPPTNQWELAKTNYNNLSTLNYTGFLKGLRILPTHFSRRLIKKKFKEIERFCEMKFDIIWSFDNSVFFDFTLLNTFNISHIVDLNQDFETKKAAHTANICFFTTKQLGTRLKPWNENTHFINHGYNHVISNKEIVLPGKNKIKLVYAGNLNMQYIDWQTLLIAVNKNPEADFIFIGPIDKNVTNDTVEYRDLLCEKNNVHLIARVESNELPNYYKAASALLICYQDNHHIDQANPHKMMEYLGSGKPIIATFTEEYVDLDTIFMSKENSEWPRLVDEVITNFEIPNDLLSEKRMQYALDNTYKKQIERIEKLINETQNSTLSI